MKVLFDYFISGYCDVHPMYFPYDSHLCFVSFINNNPLHEQEIFRLNYTMTQNIYHPQWDITHLVGSDEYPMSMMFPNQSEYPGPFDDDTLCMLYIHVCCCILS